MIATKTKELVPLSAPEVLVLINGVFTGRDALSSLASSNTQALRTFFVTPGSVTIGQAYALATYVKGDTIVSLGMISAGTVSSPSDFSYADVPLGFIIEGEVVVVKGGKATKMLAAGDFIGLFETSDWLNTHHKRNIGDWTLITNSKTKIIYFGASVLGGQGNAAHQLRNYLIGLARSDQVPQPITTLPLLDWVASHTTKARLSDYAIVAHTHLLPNNFPFFRHLAYLVGFGRMFVLEKPYSTVQGTYNDLIKSGCEVIQVRMEPGLPYEYAVQKSVAILWTKVIEELKKNDITKLLLVDDGGDLWASIPWEALHGVSICGVEQTQRGITRLKNSHLRIPSIVNVASSGAKKLVESLFIGRSVVDKLFEGGHLRSKRIGIMGMGSIGAAVLASLKKLGLQPLHYDPSYHHHMPANTDARASIDSLFNDSDIIIGTTGTDSMKGVAVERIHGHKVLASASSADVEFSSLLKMAPATTSPFSTRQVRIHEDLMVDILNGGYPLNFDRENNATPSDDIVLTRCLLYIGAMQAVGLNDAGRENGAMYPLDGISQKKTLERWINEKNASTNQSPIAIQDIDRIVSATSPQTHIESFHVWND